MRPWRSSFVTRWAALFSALIIAVVLLSGWLRDRASRQYFLKDQHRNLAHRVELIRVRAQSGVDGVCKDILYLSRAPVFGRLAQANGPGERAAALAETAVHIRGGLEVRPAYFQARLIGLADGGREIMRFEQKDGQIQQAPDSELQRQKEEACFLEATRLKPGQLYLSDIRLDQQAGRLAEPHKATICTGTPVFGEDGAPFGVVAVKVDVGPFFEELRALAGPDISVTVCNGQGDYLCHPCATKCFGFDLGQRFNLFDDHPQLAQGARHERFEDTEDEVAITDEFPFAPGSDKRLILRLALATTPLLAPLQAQRVANLAATLGLALIAGAVVFTVTNLLSRSLRRVAEAVGLYEPGKPLPELPADSSDEVGLLTRKFREMAAKISEQMQSLQEARQRAEAGVRAREEFLATISHEIRTPMNAVLGIAHLLESEGSGPHEAEKLRTLKFAGRHLMALLNNLLDRERIEAGDIVLDRIDFDLRDLLENLQRSLEPLARRKGLDFLLEISPQLPEKVKGDPVRLYQVLNNIAHNAIKFTELGQVRVRAEPGAANQVRFQVCDTGPGLPGPLLESLRRSRRVNSDTNHFNLSQTLSDSLSKNQATESICDAARDRALSAEKEPACLPLSLLESPSSDSGTPSNHRTIAEDCERRADPACAGPLQSGPVTSGLGLRISQRLIELLGGRLAAASSTEGATLSFCLPLAATGHTATTCLPETPPDLSGYSALAVEDVASNQMVLGALLKRSRMSCQFAETAAQARGCLQASRYDFAFLDIQLPDAQGTDLAVELSRTQPGMRIFAVTAQVSPAIRQACQAAGVREFVSKPINPTELYEKLRRLTAPRLEAIETLFDHDAAKVSEYLSQLDRECESWQTELREFKNGDTAALRRLHHRMKNAIGQLDLWKLDQAMDELHEATQAGRQPDRDQLLNKAVRLIETVRHSARRSEDVSSTPLPPIC